MGQQREVEPILKKLGQLRDEMREVHELQARLAALRRGHEGIELTHLASLETYLTTELDTRTKEVEDMLRQIGNISDSRLRQVLRYRFIDGRTWRDVAYKIGEYDEQIPRKVVSRYIARLSSSGAKQ